MVSDMLLSLSHEPPAGYATPGLPDVIVRTAPSPIHALGAHLVLEPEQPFDGFASFDRSIAGMLRTVRGQQVILDHDLAALYGVDTEELRGWIGQHAERFPEGSLFQLRQADLEQLPDRDRLALPHALPRVFTETGVLVAAFVIGGSQAIVVGTRIIHLFLRMRGVLFHHSDILLRLEQLEKRASGNILGIQVIMDDLNGLFDRPSSGPQGQEQGQ
jgi:hypothetical protein